MAVKLRLRRMGKKKQPIYKVVAADVRSPRDGKFLEAIGLYNPLTNPHTININEDRALYWLSVGAQPTDTVKSLLTQKGILLKRELISRGLSEDKIEAEMSNWAKMREAKQKSLKVQKKKSKKAAAKEAIQAEVKTEEPETKVEETEVKTEEPEIKEDNSNQSTTEVKGTASEEDTEKKEN
ncbi:MAG: 30S ribosomal protein S16 [Bacteroidetes bacterium]|nr:30S ribosomal protein S16 [Bacteroidota bacterium]